MNKKHVGSNFEDFLREEGIEAEVEAAAIKKVIAVQIEQLMKEKELKKNEMADRMHTSRAALDRLLDPNNPAVTLQTLEKAAIALGKRLRVELV